MELEKRIKRLEDIEEVRSLRMRYHDYVNSRQFGKVAELYIEDGTVDLDYTTKCKGRQQIFESFNAFPDVMDMLLQFIHNHYVDINGDRANAFAYLHALYAKDGVSLVVAGRYEEDYERQTDGRWLISNTKFRFYFSVPLSQGWAEGEKHHLPIMLGIPYSRKD